MPRRTNQHQRLTKWLQESLAGLDASVRESAMLYDHRAHVETEVDILIEFQKHGATYRTGIECRNHSRNASIDWIRELCTKRDDCKLDKIVAVHSKGYSKPAIQLAREHNILVLTLANIPTSAVSSSLALRYFGRPIVSTSIISVDIFVEGDKLKHTNSQVIKDFYLPDKNSTTSVHQVLDDLISKHPPPTDTIEEGQYSDIELKFGVQRGRYFVKCGEAFYEVMGLIALVRVCKGQYVTGTSPLRLQNALDDSTLGEIACQRVPGPGGIWTYGITVDSKKNTQQLFSVAPPGIGPFDTKIDLLYQLPGNDKVFEIPGRRVFFDERGNELPLCRFRVLKIVVDYNDTGGIRQSDILGFFYRSQTRSLDIAEYVKKILQEGGMPKPLGAFGEHQRKVVSMIWPKPKKPPVLMKIRCGDDSRYVRVNSIIVTIEYWRED